MQALLNRNNGNRGQQQTNNNQQPAATPTPIPAAILAERNNGTPEQAARLDAFLKEHPTGSPWDISNVYKSNAACGAFAFQAQELTFDDYDSNNYVWSNSINDIRQYSVVEFRKPAGGSHLVFVTKVNDDGSFTCAEGNVSGKVRTVWTYNWNADQIMAVWNHQ